MHPACKKSCYNYFQVAVYIMHRVPKLATPLASNTLNSVWSSWISAKYRTLHYLDYKVWLVLQQQVYKVKVNNVDELRQRIQTVWDELDQRIIDKVIKWRTRLRACVDAKGGHFEHKLWRLVQNERLHECFTFCKKNLSSINDFTLTYL